MVKGHGMATFWPGVNYARHFRSKRSATSREWATRTLTTRLGAFSSKNLPHEEPYPFKPNSMKPKPFESRAGTPWRGIQPIRYNDPGVQSVRMR